MPKLFSEELEFALLNGSGEADHDEDFEIIFINYYHEDPLYFPTVNYYSMYKSTYLLMLF